MTKVSYFLLPSLTLCLRSYHRARTCVLPPSR
jgi:hypothetical protein